MAKKKLKILIAPASYDGRKIFRKYKNNKKFLINGFIDNDIKKKKLYKKKVFHSSQIKKLNFDKIITGGRYYKEIFNQFLKKKIPVEKMIILPKSKFDFSKKELSIRSKKTDKIFKTFLKIISEEGINYFLDASSILAIIRKVSLAKFSDVDILIEGDKSGNFLKKIKEFKNIIIKKDYALKNNSKTISRIILFSKKKNIYEEPCIIDIAFFWKDRKGMYKYFVNKKTYLPKKIFSNYRELKYKKYKVRIPFNYKSYMKSLFGKNWIKPDDYFVEKTHFKGLFKTVFFKNF